MRSRKVRLALIALVLVCAGLAFAQVGGLWQGSAGPSARPHLGVRELEGIR